MIFRRLIKAIDKFVPSNLLEGWDAHARFRARVIISVSVVSSVIGIFALLVYLNEHKDLTLYAASLLVFSLLLLLPIALLRRFHTIDHPAAALVLTMTSFFIVLICMEGVAYSSTIYWLAVLPLFAVFLMGIRVGAFFALLVSVTYTALILWWKKKGFSLPIGWTYDNFLSSTMVDTIGITVACFAAGASFEIARRRSEREFAAQQIDIAKRKRLSELGELSAGLAHEINNPLAVIIGLMEIGQRKIVHSSLAGDKEFSKLMHKVSVNSHRIATIVNSLRIYASDTGNPPQNEYNLRRLIDQAVSACRERVLLTGTNLRRNLDTENVSLICHDAHIKQIITCLLDNSLDALKNQSNAEITIDVENRNGDLAISITDNGPGIPDNIREKVTNPFFTTKPVGQGIGLGLSIASGLAKASGGKLEFPLQQYGTRVELILSGVSN